MKQNPIRKNGLRLLMALLAMALLPAMAHAQKFALIDMEYILKNIPAYERANEQLNQTSKKWQAEVEALNNEASTLYKNYQNEMVLAPIQEEVYNAVKEVADYRGYSLVLDRSSDQGIIFGSPKIDISNEVLQRLGYNR